MCEGFSLIFYGKHLYWDYSVDLIVSHSIDVLTNPLLHILINCLYCSTVKCYQITYTIYSTPPIPWWYHQPTSVGRLVFPLTEIFSIKWRKCFLAKSETNLFFTRETQLNLFIITVFILSSFNAQLKKQHSSVAVKSTPLSSPWSPWCSLTC